MCSSSSTNLTPSKMNCTLWQKCCTYTNLWNTDDMRKSSFILFGNPWTTKTHTIVYSKQSNSKQWHKVKKVRVTAASIRSNENTLDNPSKSLFHQGLPNWLLYVPIWSYWVWYWYHVIKKLYIYSTLIYFQ